MLRSATKADLPAIAAAENGVWEKLPLPGKFKPEYFAMRLGALIDAGSGVIVADFDEAGTVRAAAGAVVGFDFQSAEPVAHVAFWTANPKIRSSAGVRVFKFLEDECRKAGAKHLFATHLFDSNAKRMNKAFKRWGFLPAQATYVKGL